MEPITVGYIIAFVAAFITAGICWKCTNIRSGTVDE